MKGERKTSQLKIARNLLLINLTLSGCSSLSKLSVSPTPISPQGMTRTPTSEVPPTQYLTDTPSPTFTPEPTSVPTEAPLPTSYADPELQRRLLENFFAKTGFSSLEQALEDFALSNDNYKEFEKHLFFGMTPEQSYWSNRATYMLVGIEKISIDWVDGGRSGDFAQIAYVARPGLEANPLFPLIVGIKINGIWEAAPNNVGIVLSDGSVEEIKENLDTDLSLEKWFRERIGGALFASLYLRFDNPGDWLGVHFDNSYYFNHSDASQQKKELMDLLQGNYLQRTTADHSLLGPATRPTLRGGWAETPTLEQVSQLLDPNVDIGFFVERIWAPEYQ